MATTQEHEAREADRPLVRDEVAAPGAPAAPDYGVPVRLHVCGGCGIRFAVEAAADAGRCPLCGAGSPRAPGEADLAGVGPTRAVPFAVTPAKATALFHRWLSRLRLRPPPFARLARARGLRGVYLPLWVADATLRSRWTAEVSSGPALAPSGPGAAPPRRWDEVSGERVERIGEAWPAIDVPADWPAPPSLLDPAGLVPWAPEYLAGWSAVLHPGAPAEAFRDRREELFARAREGCAAAVPGAAYRALRVDTEVEIADIAPALVPAYVAAIPWRGRVYRFVIDGRTGRADGDAPFSPGKVAGLIAAGVLAVAAMGAALAAEPPPPAPAAPPASQAGP